MEISPTSLTSALVSQLKSLFPDISIYRESVPAQLLLYPHFFVQQLALNAQPERRHYLRLNYSATIQYHHSPDSSTSFTGLQEHLDTVALALLSELDRIYWDGFPVSIATPRVEKIDGVLHWFGNISVLASAPAEPDPLQEKLNLTYTMP